MSLYRRLLLLFLRIIMNFKFEKPVFILDAAKAVPMVDLPGAELTNRELSHLMAQVQFKLLQEKQPRHIEVSDVDFPYDRVGIRSRRILDQLFGVKDLAAAASHKVLAGRSDLGRLRAIIVSTVTADKIVPSVASALQFELRIQSSVQAFDLRIGCSGYAAALEISARLLQSYPPGSMVLTVGADCMSRVLDASDRGTCILFGDGGGAVLLGTSPAEEDADGLGAVYGEPWHMVSAESYTDGSRGDLIEIKDEDNQGKTIYRFVAHGRELAVEPDELSKMTVFMNGRAVYRDMVRLVPDKIREHLKNLDLSVGDVDLFLFHQANARMIEAIASRLEIPDYKLHNNIEDMGNTTNGCLPCLIADEVRHNNTQLRRAMVVAFGTGYGINLSCWERSAK